MCGGGLEIDAKMTIGTCQYCGSIMTLPKDTDDRKANQFNRANHLRRQNDFDKAAAIYETILFEDKTDAEVYWSLVLCKYGIEYVEDPETHQRIPTCNRTQFISILADEDYKQALVHSDSFQRSIYEEEARKIDNIQKVILEVSRKEEPFDIFICYKEIDDNGRRTPDSVLAQELYYQLIHEGFKVFFSRITLEDKIGTAFEPHIFAAILSAEVMVVIGTKPEFITSAWVKNEWSRYLALIKSGAKKTLIPAYRDMDPYELPEEFSHLQAQDMGKLGFMQDLVRGICKLTGKGVTPVIHTGAAISLTAGASQSEPLLKRAFLTLETGDWQNADALLEQVLNHDPDNAKAYIGKLMVQHKVRKELDLAKFAAPISDNINYQFALRFANENLKTILEGYNQTILDRLEDERIRREEDERRNREDENRLAILCAEEEARQKENEKYDIYADALKRGITARSAIDLSSVAISFRRLDDYQDAKAQAERYERIAEEAEKREKRRKMTIALLICITVAVTIAIMLFITQVVIPSNQYYDAEQLLSVGDYDGAIAAFTEIEDYKDSSERVLEIKAIQYTIAEQLLLAGDYDGAIATFTEIKGYKDSEDRIFSIQYTIAEQLLLAGDYDGAIATFTEIKGYKDSEDRIFSIQYTIAEQLLLAGDYDGAIATFLKIKRYKDSEDRIFTIQYTIAEQLLLAGDYDGAIATFLKTKGAKESEEILTAIQYDIAKKLLLAGDLQKEDVISWGILGGEPIQWQVLKVEYDRALLIAKSCVEEMPYNASNSSVRWENCTLRQWLNEEFLRYYSQDQIANIIDVNNETIHIGHLGKKVGTTTLDKLFLLSLEEVQSLFTNNASRVSHFQENTIKWWLRSTCVDSSTGVNATYVDNYGDIIDYGDDVFRGGYGVRPALWLNLKTITE